MWWQVGMLARTLAALESDPARNATGCHSGGRRADALAALERAGRCQGSTEVSRSDQRKS